MSDTHDDLVAACKAAHLWLVLYLAMMERDQYAQTAIENLRADIEKVNAALAKAAPPADDHR